MKRLLAVVTLWLGGSTIAIAQPLPALLVVGMPHFANPGRDIVNIKVEGVLSPDRQREIQALVARLAAFRPTHVAVEWEPKDQGRLDQRYADYRAGRYQLTRNETDQIGLRLAAKLGLPSVDAVDWLEQAPGRDEDYDFEAWLKTHGRGAEWEAFKKTSQAEADEEGAFQRCHPIADWVRNLNNAAGSNRLSQPYFEIATFGDRDNNPGAAWVGTWYARNLRIYANLLRIAGKPGDRTIAIFGAGHGPLLRSDAAQSGKFSVVDVLRFLPPSSRLDCSH